jgi:RND family efflux transporter MFP subunit
VWPAYKFLTRPTAAPAAARGGPSFERPAVEVRTVAIVRKDLVYRTTLPGSVLADNQVTLYAKISGYLKSISVDRGDWVEAEQPIAEIAVPETDRDLLTAYLDIQYAGILVKEAEQAAAEAVLARTELELAKVEAENQQRAAEIGLRAAEAAVVEGESSLAAAKADAHLQRLTFDRIAALFDEKSATAQERDQQKGKSLMSEAAARLAEARLSSTRLLIDAAKAKLETARTQVETAAARLALGTARVESAKSKVAAATAKVRLAESAKAKVEVVRKYAEIRAPFAGIITTRHVDPGAMIQNAAGSRSGADPLVTIAAVDKVRVVVDIPEREVKNVGVGSRCRLQTDSLPGRSFENGRIVRTAKAVDPKTRTMPVEAEFDNIRSGTKAKPDFLFYPGMYGRLTLDLATVKDALVIPAAALAVESRKPYVYAVRDGRIKKFAVSIGYDDGTMVQITDAPQLAAGDRVVVGDKAGLADGRAVKLLGDETAMAGH